MAQARRKRILTAGATICLALLIVIPAAHSQPEQKNANPPATHRPDVFLQAGHTRFVRAVAISLDQRWIASGGDEKTILLWDAATGEPVARFTGHTSQIVQLALPPDGGQLASTGYDGMVRVYDVNKRTLLYVSRLGQGARIQYSADGKLWAAGASGKGANATSVIEVHDSATGDVVKTFTTEWLGVAALAITKDGLLVASGATDDEPQPPGSVHVWDISSGEIKKSWPIAADAISADGRFMGRIDYNKTPRQAVIVDVASGAEKLGIPLKNEQAIYFSADGNLFALTDPMSTQLRLGSTGGGEVRTIGPASGPGETGLGPAAFSSDGKSLVAAPYADHAIRLWSTADGKEMKVLYGQAMVQSLSVESNGELIAGTPHGLDVWDVAGKKRRAVITTGYVNVFAQSADGRWLAVNPGVRYAGETGVILDLKSKAVIKEFTFGKGGSPVSGLAFVMNDSPLKELGPLSRSFEFTAEDGKHTVWSSPSPIASSPDGKMMAVQFGGLGDVDIWDMATGSKIVRLTAHRGTITDLVFSPDGRSLVTAGQDSPAVVGYMPRGDWKPDWGVKVWNVATWKPTMSVSFSRTGATCVALSPDGKKIAVEKAWDKVDVLDAETGAVLESLVAKDPNPNYHQWARQNLRFSADGKSLYQGAQDGIRMWKLKEP